MPGVWEICRKWERLMDRENATARKKLKQIETVKEFEELLSLVMLSEEEKQMLRMHYKDKKTMQCIADEMGLSEISVKKMHKRALTKIRKLF